MLAQRLSWLIITFPCIIRGFGHFSISFWITEEMRLSFHITQRAINYSTLIKSNYLRMFLTTLQHELGTLISLWHCEASVTHLTMQSFRCATVRFPPNCWENIRSKFSIIKTKKGWKINYNSDIRSLGSQQLPPIPEKKK